MQNADDIPLCRVDCGPLNDSECLACKEAQPDPVYICCQSCIHRGLSSLENPANPTPTLQPEMQGLKHALRKRKAPLITEASLERNDCAPLGTINCLACDQPQQHPIYVYCQDCLQDGAGRTATRSLDLELQALKEVLMRRRSQVTHRLA